MRLQDTVNKYKRKVIIFVIILLMLGCVAVPEVSQNQTKSFSHYTEERTQKNNIFSQIAEKNKIINDWIDSAYKDEKKEASVIDLIVTSDKHLLDLKTYENIGITNIAGFLYSMPRN